MASGAAKRSLLRTSIDELHVFQQLVRTWRERFTAQGRRAFVALAVLSVLGVDTRRNQTFLLFAIAAGLHVAALVFVRLSPRVRARLALALPARATAGEPVEIRGRVTVEEGRGALLRVAFGQRVVARRLAIEPDDVVVACDDAERGAGVEVRFALTPKRRGRYVLGPVTLRALEPLGLLAGEPLDTVAGHVVLVAPPVFDFALREGALGRRLQPGGIPLAIASSDAMELVGTREWRPGDRLRNVHWRSFARRGTPIVKEFQEEFFPRVAIVLDTRLPEIAPARTRARKIDVDADVAREAFEAALSVAASITSALAEQDHVVELLAAGPELHRVTTGRGLGPLESVLDVLACVEPDEPNGDAPLAPPLASIAPAVEMEIAQIGTVYAVLLDWDDARRAFVDRLRALGAEVRAVIVREQETSAPLARDDVTITRMPPSAVAQALRSR